AGTRWLVANLEIAEARQLHGLAARERIAYLFEERVDNVLGFTLVQAHPLEQQFGEFGLGKGARLGKHGSPLFESGALPRAMGAGQRLVDTCQAIGHASFVQRDLSVL